MMIVYGSSRMRCISCSRYRDDLRACGLDIKAEQTIQGGDADAIVL